MLDVPDTTLRSRPPTFPYDGPPCIPFTGALPEEFRHAILWLGNFRGADRLSGSRKKNVRSGYLSHPCHGKDLGRNL